MTQCPNCAMPREEDSSPCAHCGYTDPHYAGQSCMIGLIVLAAVFGVPGMCAVALGLSEPYPLRGYLEGVVATGACLLVAAVTMAFLALREHRKSKNRKVQNDNKDPR